MGRSYIPEILYSIFDLLFHTSSHIHPGLTHAPNVIAYNKQEADPCHHGICTKSPFGSLGYLNGSKLHYTQAWYPNSAVQQVHQITQEEKT